MAAKRTQKVIATYQDLVRLIKYTLAENGKTTERFGVEIRSEFTRWRWSEIFNGDNQFEAMDEFGSQQNLAMK